MGRASAGRPVTYDRVWDAVDLAPQEASIMRTYPDDREVVELRVGDLHVNLTVAASRRLASRLLLAAAEIEYPGRGPYRQIDPGENLRQP